METANYLCRQDVLPAGRVRMWLGGRWEDVEMFGFEITDQPVGRPHTRQVEQWAYEGLQALGHDDGLAAETLFQKCIESEGERPDLLNNLAAAYDMQGKTDQSIELLRQIHERWPDYFFGRIAMANLAAEDGDYERGEAYLAPLRQRRRLHITEFTALATAYVRLSLDRENRKGAQSWLRLWREIDPDHPDLARLESQCATSRFAGLLWDRLCGRRW
jgi:tetratricopeptide (TPR) repeat protein